MKVGAVVGIVGPGCSRLMWWEGQTERFIVDDPPHADASFDEWRAAAVDRGVRMAGGERIAEGGWYVIAFKTTPEAGH